MELHVGNQLVLRDAADDAADIRGANTLAKQVAEVGVTQRVGGNFVGAIDAGVISTVENKLTDRLDREGTAVHVVENGWGRLYPPVLSRDDQAVERLLQGYRAGRFAAYMNEPAFGRSRPKGRVME